MAPTATPRLHLLPAREAPIVVIIRRKPRNVFHVMRWNTETDAVEHGSWFRGKLYPDCCDVSFDGEWMVYLALGAGAKTWTGICKPPWLRTICEEERHDTYGGGGFWSDRMTLCTYGWSDTPIPEDLPFRLSQGSRKYSQDERVLGPRMVRDGWRRLAPYGEEGDTDPVAEYQPTAGHPRLLCFHRGHLEDRGQTFEFRLDGHPELLDRSVDWASWDSLGQLVVARSGAVEKYTLSDLAKGKRTFSQSFEDLEPTLHPAERKRKEHWPRFESPLLQRIVDAFDRRWKSIRNGTIRSTCEGHVDEDAGKTSERLDIEADVSEGRPIRVRLSVWDDSALWLAIHRSGKEASWFGMEFHGDVRSVSVEEIVRRFEATLTAASRESPREITESEVALIWDKAALRPKKPS